MTVTPFPVIPPDGPARPGKPAPTATAAGETGFAALVARLVAGHVGAADGALGGGRVGGPTAETSTEAPVEEPIDQQGAAAAGDAVDAVAVAGAVPVPVLPPDAGGAPEQGTTGVPEVTGTVSGAGDPATGSAAAGPGVGVGGDPSGTETGAADAAATTPGATGSEARTGKPTDAAPSGSGTTPVDPGSTPTPATAHSSPPPRPEAGARVAAPVPVVSQVVPEVTRLASRGDGTHRLTMTLQPESLGEVRVTLTVRQGEVHVRLAADTDAQRALADGAPELRRVLELAGATDTRVVVRDLAPVATHHATHQAAQGPAAAPQHGGQDSPTASGQGRHHHDDQPAGTRAGSTATDGTSDGANPPRPEPVRHARSTGVDLTM